MMAEHNYLSIDPSNKRWEDFIKSQPNATIFHHPAWLRLIEECYGYRSFVAILSDVNGDICAGLPMMEVRSIFARHRWVSIPFSDHCVPLTCDSATLRKLLDTLTIEANKPGAPKIELRWSPPAQFGIQSSAEYVLHTIQLDNTVEKVEERIHHSHRRNIKTAQSHGVHIKFGKELDDVKAFYSLHLQTRHRQGVPIQPYHFFELLHKNLIDQGLGFVLLAYEKEQCLAGAVFLHWNHTLTYKYGASRPDDLYLRPNHLIFWHAIQWGCNNGYTKLDLGRSSIENMGLRNFKSRWGAQETPLFYSSLPPKFNQISNHNFHNIMNMVRLVIQKSPVWVCRLSGEILYKYFA